MKCYNCKSKKLNKVIKVGKQPISSVFPKKKLTLKNYSLDLYKCKNCSLIQLPNVPPMKSMYGETYGYRTSLSPLMINHMRKKFLKIIKLFKFTKKNYVLDIGSNDGTFLNFFSKKKFINLYGVDPSAKKYDLYYKKNIKKLFDYFDKKKIINRFGDVKFDLITSFAMFYDITDPNKFCKEIQNLLNDNGIWILELSYLPMLIENLTYDQICHEHVTYYDLTTIKKIFKKNGLKILDIEFNDINGGSFNLICSKIHSKHKSKRSKILKILNYEKKITDNTYKTLNLRIDQVKKNILTFLNLCKNSKKKVIGYGASTKGNIVLNQCKINDKLLKFICDANEYKYNRYTPGSNIKIISKRKMRKINPDYLFVLIWPFRKEVIKQEINYIKKGGKLIFHLPIFHIIDKFNYKNYLNEKISNYATKI